MASFYRTFTEERPGFDAKNRKPGNTISHMKNLTYLLSALILLATATVRSQDQDKPAESAKPAAADPFVQKEEAKQSKAAPESKKAAPDKVTNVGTIFQYIDVKRERWQKWLSENETPLDAGALRREVDGWLTTGEAELAETSLVMGKSGQRSKVESIREVFYPSQFDSEKSGLPVPTAFELRHQGTTSEVDPVIGLEGRIDLNFAPERVTYAGENPPREENGAEDGDVRWPLFRSQRVMSQVSLAPEEWALIGCESSLDGEDSHQTLIFARPALHQFEDTPAKGNQSGEAMLTFQWLEVAHEQLNNWLMNAGDISAWIGGGLNTKALGAGAKILDERVMRFRSGQRIKNESIKEVIYPTEYTRDAEGKNFATPTANETRNVGVTVEVDPVFGTSGGILDLNMAPEQVFHFGESVHHRFLDSGKWQPNITMPVFYVIKTTTQITLPAETPVLISVMSPPDENGVIDSSRKVLLFVKFSH